MFLVWAFLVLLKNIIMNCYNHDKTLVPVSREFIEDALYTRFDAVKDCWASEIHREKIDEFVELVSECWWPIHSASYVIDNWLINWEHWTYEACWLYSMNENSDRQDTNEQIEAVEDYLSYNGYLYDRDLREYCSF